MPTKKKPKQLPRSVWAVADSKGEVFCFYANKQEAIDDVIGPRFRKGWTLLEYTRTSVKRMEY